MKNSKRAKRMQRHHRRSKAMPAFNMISLMDIFTILVFFLLVNSSEVEVLPNAKGIELPESVAEISPRESVVVMVTDAEVLVQGKTVISVKQVSKTGSVDIAPLKRALRGEADKRPVKSKQAAGREVTIMGDKEIPYNLLKKVMLSCTRAGFSKISLSVLQKARQQG
jgi:biopolymer transport protein ExbD